MSWDDIWNLEEAKELIWSPYETDKSSFSYSKELDWFDFRGKSVLDFGGGVGRCSEHICTRASFTVLYDYQNMLNLAVSYLGDKAQKVVMISPPIIKLMNFRFDIVIACLVLQHMPEKGIREAMIVFQRVLEHDGQLFIIDRGWLDEDKKSTWSIVDEYFQATSEGYEPDNVEKHQAIFFKKRTQ